MTLFAYTVLCCLGSLIRKKKLHKLWHESTGHACLKKNLLALKVDKYTLVEVNTVSLKQDGIESQTELY